MTAYLDIDKYFMLPTGLKSQLDKWLTSEELDKRYVTKIWVHGEVVTIERLAVQENGFIAYPPEHVVEHVATSTLPPKEVFA